MAISSQWFVNLSDDVTSKPKHLETQIPPSSSIFLPAMAASVISDGDPFISLGTVLCFTDIIWQELIYFTSLSHSRHKWCFNHYHPYWDKFLNKELSPQKRTGKEEGGGNKHKEIVLYWLSMKWEWSSQNPTHSFLVTLLGKQMSRPFKRILLLCALEKHKEDTIHIFFPSQLYCSTNFPIRAIELSILRSAFDIPLTSISSLTSHSGFPTSQFQWFSITFPCNYMLIVDSLFDLARLLVWMSDHNNPAFVIQLVQECSGVELYPTVLMRSHSSYFSRCQLPLSLPRLKTT